MGMHHGVIVVEGTAEELLGALAAAGKFRAGATVASMEEVPETDAEGEKVLVAGDLDGRPYLFDDSLLLASDADLIADASRRLGRRVLAIGAETTSGSYFLTAATGGQVERQYWDQIGGLVKPYDVGPALAGEPTDGLDDVDGQRLHGVLAAAGFDPDGWMNHGRKVIV